VSDKISQSEVCPRFDGKWSILSQGYISFINKAKSGFPISKIKTPHATVVMFTRALGVRVCRAHAFGLCLQVEQQLVSKWRL